MVQGINSKKKVVVGLKDQGEYLLLTPSEFISRQEYGKKKGPRLVLDGSDGLFIALVSNNKRDFSKINTLQDLINYQLRNKVKFRNLFHNTYLNRALFVGVDLCESEFLGAQLVGANFSYTNLWRTKFKESYICRSDFTSSNFDESIFIETNIIDSNFRAAKLIHGGISTGILSKTNFTGTDFTGSSISCVRDIDPTIKNSILRDIYICSATRNYLDKHGASYTTRSNKYK